MHTKDKGDVAEQFVMAHCLKRGWIVSKTIGDNKRYDFILDKGDNALYKVQVKSGRLNDGVIIIDTKSSGYKINKGEYVSYNKKYSLEDVDYIASYCPDTNQSYIIKNEGIYQINLRVDNSKNNQIKGIRFAKDYLI